MPEFDLSLRFVVFYASYAMRPAEATAAGCADRLMVSPTTPIIPGIGLRLPLTR